MRDFQAIVDARAAERRFIIMGLDPVWDKLPEQYRHRSLRASDGAKAAAFYNFCVAVVDATHDLVAGYKPNAAFFEALGWEGERALEKLIKHIRAHYPEVVIVIDAKRGDIGDTNLGYVAKFFKRYQVDAITLTPMLGEESLRPFLDCEGKGVILLCKTSNPGSDEFQDLKVRLRRGDTKRFGLTPKTRYLALYEYMAHRFTQWKSKATICVVVGATYPKHLADVRGILPDMLILIPGVGKQGGKMEDVLDNGLTEKLNGIAVNAGSKVLFASQGADFAQAARAGIVEMNNDVQLALVA